MIEINFKYLNKHVAVMQCNEFKDKNPTNLIKFKFKQIKERNIHLFCVNTNIYEHPHVHPYVYIVVSFS